MRNRGTNLVAWNIVACLHVCGRTLQQPGTCTGEGRGDQATNRSHGHPCPHREIPIAMGVALAIADATATNEVATTIATRRGERHLWCCYEWDDAHVAEAIVEGSSSSVIAAAAAGSLLVARGGMSARCVENVVE